MWDAWARRCVAAVTAATIFLPSCAHDAEPTREERGRQAYDRTCALCHGPSGEGYAADNATALRSSSFLATASDVYLSRSIARGRPGTTMSAWSQRRGGPHDEAAIADIVAYFRTWQTEPAVALETAPALSDAARGARTYATTCASCHGATGNEGPNVRLANAELLDVASDAFLRYAIVHGRPGTTMRAFGELAPSDVDDLVALLRSWAKPVAPGDAPFPGTLGPVVLNPGGPDPGFSEGTRFIAVDIVKAALDRGSAMGFLDARPPSDYVASHIAGATNVPFYEATAHLAVLPRDKWLVCYCACPHAESGVLADALFANGFTKVAILDEGLYVWRDRGYPVRSGPAP